MAAPDSPEAAARVLDGLNAVLSDTSGGGPLDEAQLLELGEAALTLVLLRTKQGLDADRKPFTPYSPKYAAWRAGEKGLAKQPVDLAVTGHMLGSFKPEILEPGSVTVHSMSEFEAMKAVAHNEGVDKVVTVKQGGGMGRVFRDADTRRFVSPKRAMPTTVAHFFELQDHQRRQHLDRREFLDIRHPDDLAFLGGVFGDKVQITVERHLKKAAK